MYFQQYTWEDLCFNNSIEQLIAWSGSGEKEARFMREKALGTNLLLYI